MADNLEKQTLQAAPAAAVGNGDLNVNSAAGKREQAPLDASDAPNHASDPEKPAVSGNMGLPQEEDLDLPLSAADGLVKKPFARPVNNVKVPSPPTLTSEQEGKYASLLKTVSAWTEVPTKLEKGAPKAPITEGEKMFMTRECLLRYLRATRWNVAEASTRLLATHTWRREYGVEEHTADYISIENETGKQMILGYDVHGRPCLYMMPSRQNTKRTDRQIQHLVFMLERVVDLMVPGQETLTLLINFKDTGTGQGSSVSQGRQTLYILQNHYPERLGRSLVTNGKHA